jgi:PAS domain S-box-containing protein
MDEIVVFFRKLADYDDWPPRWHCGNWSDFHGWLYIISDLLIWSAYFAIPLIILKFIFRKKDSGFARLYFLFASFILACGTTHLIDALIFWVPVYRISALVRLFTGIISWITVFSLIRILPRAFSLKSPKLLEEEIAMRIKAEELLRAKIDQLNDAERMGSFGHYEWDVKSNRLNWSIGTALLFELDDPSSVQTYEDYLRFIPEEERADIKAYIGTVTQGDKEYQARYQRIITAKGKPRTLYIKGKIIRDLNGLPETIVGTAQDVTEVKKNREMLEESRHLFKSAFEYSPSGIALVSFDGTPIDINQAVCNITGYTKEELQQNNFFDLIHEEEWERSMQQMERLLRKEKNSFQREKRLLHKNGSTIWTFFSKSIVWQEQSPSFYIFHIIDISEPRHLFQTLQEKNKDLKEANKNLEYHINKTNEFNRIIGHNLRGPASSLINMADFIESAEDMDEKLFLLSKVKDTSSLIIRTLEDLKDFIELKLHVPEEMVADFEEAVNKCLQLLEPEIKLKQPQLHVRLECHNVAFPKIYVESIIFNLLSNALKYHKPGEPPFIQLHTYIDEGRPVLEVTDNGIGIDLKKHKDLLFKYKSIFHPGYDSYGLGLFLIKSQIDAFGGKIEVQSMPGQGTTFTITF